MENLYNAGNTDGSGLDEKMQEHFFRALDPAALPAGYGIGSKNGDFAEACRIAVQYFRTRPESGFLADLKERDFSVETAQDAVRGKVSVVNIPYQFPDGRIDFLFDPTSRLGTYNAEWQWQLNRMYFWNDMALAYLKTGDENFARSFAGQIEDWVKIPCPSDKWNARGSAWRTIETGIRLMESWQTAFEVFRKSASVPDKTLALMLASMHEQALHAFVHKASNNWRLMELAGVHTFAALFPEFSNSAELRRNSAALFADELAKQLLPDGMQYELSPDYHMVTFKCATMMLRIARQTGTEEDLPADFHSLLERAADAFLMLTTPAFTQPRTNDCSTIRTARPMKTAAELFPERKDFLWVATNREQGEPPAGNTASRYMPWSGFAAMRSSWGADAAYLCFDVGPLGKGHQHSDKLNINLYKGGQELLFDDGGGQYDESPFRRYAISAAGHNTVLVDGEGQMRTSPATVSEPIDADFFSNEAFDYMRGIYDDAFGVEMRCPASQEREVLFVKPDFFVIADSMKSKDGCPHDYTFLFQTDTQQVEVFPDGFRAKLVGKYDLAAFVPTKGVVLRVESAVRSPVSGWYAGRDDKDLHPASTVKITAEKRRDFQFAIFLFPLRKDEPFPEISRVSEDESEVVFRNVKRILNWRDVRSNISSDDWKSFKNANINNERRCL